MCRNYDGTCDGGRILCIEELCYVYGSAHDKNKKL